MHAEYEAFILGMAKVKVFWHREDKNQMPPNSQEQKKSEHIQSYQWVMVINTKYSLQTTKAGKSCCDSLSSGYCCWIIYHIHMYKMIFIQT